MPLVGEAEVREAVHNPPRSTRAYFRGECVARYPDQIVAANWDSVVFDLGDGPAPAGAHDGPPEGYRGAHRGVARNEFERPTELARCPRQVERSHERARANPQAACGAQHADRLRRDAVDATKGEQLKADLDELLDEIDEVLEENAEEFVRNYVQKGGQ